MSKVPVWYENPNADVVSSPCVDVNDMRLLDTGDGSDGSARGGYGGAHGGGGVVGGGPRSVERPRSTKSRNRSKTSHFDKENIHRDKQSSKRKAKYESDLDSSICSQTMSSSTSSSSSRRKMCNSRCPLENIIQNGKNENLKKLRDCLNRYEKNSRPTTGLVIAYDPLTEAGVVLYHWLTDLGFTASLHNDHSVVQLPASAVASVKAALGKYITISKPEKNIMKAAFFEAANVELGAGLPTPSSSSTSEVTASTKSKSRKKNSGKQQHSSKKGSSSSRSKRKGLQVPKSSNVMEGDGDVSLSLCMSDADVAFQTISSSQDSRPLIPIASANCSSGAASKTFGRSSKQDGVVFAASSIGVGVTVVQPVEVEYDGVVETDDVAKVTTMENSITCNSDDTISTLRLRRGGDMMTRILNNLSVSVDNDSDDDLDEVRPMSACSRPRRNSLSLSADGSKARQRCHSETNASRCGTGPRKAHRPRRSTPSPSTLWGDYDMPDSVTKKMNNLVLNSAGKDNGRDDKSFSSLSNPPYLPPPPLDDVLTDVQYNPDELEDFSQSEFQNDEKPLLPLPAPINSANSLLDFSGEHSGKEEHTNVDQRLMNSGDGLMSGSNSVFSSPHHNTLPPVCPTSCVANPFKMYASDDDADIDDNNNADQKVDDVFYWEQGMYPHRVVPKSRMLKRTKTDPTSSRPPPQTPEVKCFSQTQSVQGACIMGNFSTPTTALTSHISGHNGRDFLKTECALPIMLESFWAVFRRKKVRSPKIRESTSPYLFSAMSNRQSFSDEKELAQGKKNKAFLKRMSSGGREPLKGSSFNPLTASKVKRNRKSIISNQASIVNADSKVRWVDMQGGHANLDKNSFRGAIIGGTYENCFDDNVPVVSAPSDYDKRVVGVQMVYPNENYRRESCAPTLKVFLASASTKSDRAIKTVSLGMSWVCYKVSTGGYLVSASKIIPHEKCVCYFLPKHPSKWAAATNNVSPSHSRFAIASIDVMDDSVVDCNGFNDDVDDNMDDSRDECNQIISAIDHFDADESKICHEEDDDEDQDHFQYTQVMYHNLCGAKSTVPKLRFSSSDEEEDEESIFSLHQDTQATQDTEYGGMLYPGSSTVDFEDTLDKSIDALRLNDSGDDDFDDDNERPDDQVDWNNSNVVAHVLSFLVDSSSESPSMIDTLALVSKSWALECFKIRASDLSLPGACQQLDHHGWVRFMKEYGDGKFLSAGACKDVFCVYSQSRELSTVPASFQAVSVMDMIDLQERDVADSIARELEISMLCSSLVSLNICPNLLQVYSLFQSEYPPCSSLWKRGKGLEFPSSQQISESDVRGAIAKLSPGEYQYIRMEYCASGDLEEVVRGRSGFDPVEVRSMLFQMCFALYTCREQLSMRHYDVKLLNFFSTGAESLLKSGEFDSSLMHDKSRDDNMCPCIDVGFGEHTYSLPLGNAHSQSAKSMVKLADFGTSCVGPSTLSLPITAHQFTTLENTPPEYLFLGSHARECYSADTFCLGLSYFHLLAGEEPYEEHLKEVLCPSYLKGKLQKLWKTSNVDSQYHVIADVIDSLDNDESGDVLFDTFYRYLVMFDLDISAFTETDSNDSCEVEYPYPPNNAVLCAAIDCLGLDPDRMMGRVSRLKQEGIDQFELDRAKWSLREGNGIVMERVRNHLSLLGEGSMELLCMMVDLDASKRCSLHEALTSPLFHAMRVPDCSYSAEFNGGRSFMHYKNKQFLPIF